MAVDPGEAAPMVWLDQLLDAKLSIPQPRPGSVSRAKLNSGQLQANSRPTPGHDDGSYDLCFGHGSGRQGVELGGDHSR